MDIKKLTQEVLLKNMTPEQQLAVLESVTASVKEAKAVQKQKIAENVDLVLQALKRIEADMLKRVDNSAEIVEARVKTIKDGKDGKNGLDGKAGKDGINGKDGKDGRDGRDGLNGKAGERGQDGVGVQDAHIDFDGSLIISLTNGQELNVGEVVPFDVAEKIKVIGNGGGTSQYVLDTLAELQTAINNLIPSQTGNSGKFLTTNGTTVSWASVAGGLSYQGTWNASTNTPTLASSTGTNGYYYVVSTAGSTNLNGITDWQIGDWLLFNGSTWQKIDQTNSVTSVNGQTGAVVVGSVPTGGTAGQVLSKVDSTDYNSQWIDNYATQVKLPVKNATGSTITKGSVVYISGATGANALISLAKADADSTSATTVGILESTLTTGSQGFVITSGVITGIDTSAATEGDPVWLSGATAGAKVYGIANKPNAPTHIVYLGTVTRAHATVGEIQVMINNGWELDELHNVSALSPTTGQTIVYNSATSLWEKNTVSLTAGVNGTLPVANGGTGATTASGARTNLGLVIGTDVLAPNGSAASLTSFPTLNQNTTGTASNVTGTVAIANGGTGQTTASAAFNALSPVTSTGDLIVGNGTNSSTRLGIGTNGYVLTSNGTTATWQAASGGSSLPSQTGNSGKFLKTDGTNPSWSSLPSVLSVLTRAATSVSIAVGNGVLPVLNRAGSTINVAVS